MVNVDDTLEKRRALLTGEGNMSPDEINDRIPRVVLDKQSFLMRKFDGIPRKGDKGHMKEKLSEYIPEMDQKEMEEYLQNWSVTNKRPITEDARYAVAKALTTQKYIKPSDIWYILYGWDRRGDHDIEMMNTLTAIKDATTANIAEQKSFMKEFSSITTGLTTQLNKILKNITEPPKQLHVDVPQPKKFPTMASDKVPLKRSPDPKAPLVRSFVEHNVTKREKNTYTSQTDSQDQLRLKAKRILEVAGINLTELGNLNTDASAADVVIQIAKEMTEKELERYESGVYGKEVKKLLIDCMVDAE